MYLEIIEKLYMYIKSLFEMKNYVFLLFEEHFCLEEVSATSFISFNPCQVFGHLCLSLVLFAATLEKHLKTKGCLGLLPY